MESDTEYLMQVIRGLGRDVRIRRGNQRNMGYFSKYIEEGKKQLQLLKGRKGNCDDDEWLTEEEEDEEYRPESKGKRKNSKEEEDEGWETMSD